MPPPRRIEPGFGTPVTWSIEPKPHARKPTDCTPFDLPWTWALSDHMFHATKAVRRQALQIARVLADAGQDRRERAPPAEKSKTASGGSAAAESTGAGGDEVEWTALDALLKDSGDQRADRRGYVAWLSTAYWPLHDKED